jgi:metal-sulfur cluster biosynthetic enzyme
MTTTHPDDVRIGLAGAVWRALDTVHDPELDEPITDLRFVDSVEVDDDGAALVVLRLPTWFCAPNFTFLMVADAYDAVRAVDGVTSATIRLDDHFASDEINSGVAGGRGFAGSFPGMAEGELDQLRVTFWRKAHLAAQERVAGTLLRSGWRLDQLVDVRLGDVLPGPDLERLVRRRADLGFPHGDRSPLLLDDKGLPVDAVDLEAQLRMARTTRISIEGNAALCAGLLSVRYNLGQEPPEPPRGKEQS